MEEYARFLKAMNAPIPAPRRRDVARAARD